MLPANVPDSCSSNSLITTAKVATQGYPSPPTNTQSPFKVISTAELAQAWGNLLHAAVGLVAAAAILIATPYIAAQNSCKSPSRPHANKSQGLSSWETLLLICTLGGACTFANAVVSTQVPVPPAYVPYQIVTMTFCGFNYATYTGGAFNQSLFQLRCFTAQSPFPHSSKIKYNMSKSIHFIFLRTSRNMLTA